MDTRERLPEATVSNWTSTDIDDVRDDTGDTLGKTGNWNRDETEDATLRGPDGVFDRVRGRDLNLTWRRS